MCILVGMVNRSWGERMAGLAHHETRTLAQHHARTERELIERTLAEREGNISEAARLLGVTRRGLYLKMERLGVARGFGRGPRR